MHMYCFKYLSSWKLQYPHAMSNKGMFCNDLLDNSYFLIRIKDRLLILFNQTCIDILYICLTSLILRTQMERFLESAANKIYC